MRAQTVQTWIARHILVRRRLENVCTSYLLFLMVVTRKHSLEEAARFSGRHKSQFSKMLKAHSQVAVSTLESLSKKQAKQVAKARQKLKELPWDIAIVVDSTLQHRASLHPENAKTFNHGQGFVVGHQWTNIVLLLQDRLIPLRPIPFYSQRYCRDHKLTYRTEHDLVVEYIEQLNLEDYKQNLENLRRNRYAPRRRGSPCVTSGTKVMRPQGAKRCAPSKATFPIMHSRP